MGYKDLELSIKDLNSGRWSRVPTPEDYPQVELKSAGFKSNSTSPAPGRPGHEDRGDKRSRESTDNSPVQTAAKIARQGSSDKDAVNVSVSKSIPSNREQAWREALENAELVTTESAVSPGKVDRPTDRGRVTQVSGTPLKCIVQVQDKSLQSPVFSKSARKPAATN